MAYFQYFTVITTDLCTSNDRFGFKKKNNMKKMTKAEIREFNSKVEYNESVASWVIDLISCAIFFPMIVMVVYRRGKYNQKITEVESQDK